MANSFSTLILAAGKGTRMKSPLPKVLHRAAGRSLLGHVLEAAKGAGASNHYVVVGHGRDEVLAELSASTYDFKEIWQKEQKGTGHAVQMGLPFFSAKDELFVILAGDAPLVRAETLRAIVEAHKAKKADLTLGVMELENPFGYGRVITGAGGVLRGIVEEKEATPKEKKLRLVNGGLYVVSRKYLETFLPKLKPSAKVGELYLTDIVGLGAKAKKKLQTFLFQPEELLGVNDLEQLSQVEDLIRRRLYSEWMKSGVRLEAPGALWADVTVTVKPGSRIGPNVVLQGNTRVEENVIIEAGCVLKDSVLESGAELKAYSHLEDALVRKNAHVGPFARLRPKADIGEEARGGKFRGNKKFQTRKYFQAKSPFLLGRCAGG